MGVSGYEPLRRNRRQRLGELKTGDGRPLPPHLKSQIGRELDRLELLLGQIKAVEAERDALLTPATETEGMPAPQAMLIDLRVPVGLKRAGREMRMLSRTPMTRRQQIRACLESWLALTTSRRV